MKKFDALPLLKRLEWSQLTDQGMMKCPECKEARKYGHKKGCELGLAIRKMGGMTEIQIY